MSNLSDKDALDELRAVEGIKRVAEGIRLLADLAAESRKGPICQALAILDEVLDDAMCRIGNIAMKCEMDITRNEQARAREDA